MIKFLNIIELVSKFLPVKKEKSLYLIFLKLYLNMLKDQEFWKEVAEVQIPALKPITINGTNYLGTFEKKEGEILLQGAIKATGNLEKDVFAWIKAKNSDDLISKQILGDATTIEVGNFNDSRKQEILISSMRAIKAIIDASVTLENKTVDSL